MDQEGKEMLEKILRLTEDSNKILRKMHRSIVWGRIMHTLYWIIIIAISVGAYIYVQPFIDQMFSFIGTGKEGLQNIGKLSEILKSLPK